MFIACFGAAPLEEVYDLTAESLWASEGGRAASPADDVILLPDGETLSFFLRIPSGAFFAVERVDRIGGNGSTLKINLERSEEAVIKVAAIDRGGQALEQMLPDGTSEIARLELSATGREGSGQWVLKSPRVLGRPRSGSEIDTSTPRPTSSPGRPNVIIYVVDTLRFDHLGSNGYESQVSPNFDSFAKDAVIFDDAVSNSPWTKPAVASIFTGVEPPLHGVLNHETSLPATEKTLAEYLTEAEYSRQGLISNLTVRDEHGFGQGFEGYAYITREGKTDVGLLISRAVATLRDEESSKQPFFLYVHAMDPHVPYEPPEAERRKFAPNVEDLTLGQTDVLKALRSETKDRNDPRVSQVVGLYDAEIAFTDYQFGLFIDELKRQSLYDEALVIVTADHGEEFWERGWWGHGHSFFPEVTHVPLMIKPPGGAQGTRLPDLVTHVDILPTVLDYVGIEPDRRVRGRSLRPYLEGRRLESHSERAVFSYVDFQKYVGLSVTTENWKLIWPENWKITAGKPVLVDRRTDPGERVNLFEERPVVAGYLRTLQRKFERLQEEGIEHNVESIRSLSEDEEKQLRALGYLN